MPLFGDLKTRVVACDTETTGLNAWAGDRPFAFSFCDDDGNTAYVRWEVDPFTRSVIKPVRSFRVLRSFFEDKSITKVFHNAKFDVRMLEASGIRTEGPIQETLFAMHAVNNDEPSYQLKTLGAKYCEIDKEDEQELKKSAAAVRRKAKQLGWARAEDLEADYWMADPVLCERYAVLDAIRTMTLWLQLDRWMDEEEVRHTYEAEMLLWNVTYRMETRGVKVSRHVLREQIRYFQRERAKYYVRLMKQAKEHGYSIITRDTPSKVVEQYKEEGVPYINFDSAQTLSKFIYGKLGVPVTKRTKTGQPSTEQKVLARLDHPFCKNLIHYHANRDALIKFYRKYDALAVPDALVSDGGMCIHPNFNQVGPKTGRFSCRMPNLQASANAKTTHSAVPIQTRLCFGPRPGYTWWFFDWSNLEMRIFACVAKEEMMLDAFRHNRDIHGETANKMWGGLNNPRAVEASVQASQALDGMPDLIKFKGDIVALEKSYNKENSRKRAKLMNFLKIFGGGPQALSELIGYTYDEACQDLDDYDTAFPGIAMAIRRASNRAIRTGYITDAYGRKLRVSDRAPYKAINYQVQGSAASLLKTKMVETFMYIRDTGLDVHQVLTVHDEIVFEAATRAPTYWVQEVKRIMEDNDAHFELLMPVDVAMSTTNWADKKGVEIA